MLSGLNRPLNKHKFGLGRKTGPPILKMDSNSGVWRLGVNVRGIRMIGHLCVLVVERSLYSKLQTFLISMLRIENLSKLKETILF